jgi:hypothetical protein
VLDGEYGADDTVRIGTDASHFTLRHAEVRHSGRDLIDLTAPPNVTIEDSLLHHALNSTGGRSDAHGIVAGPVQDLVVRNTEIHTFSGDAVQVDPGRSAPGWNRVLIDGCRFWLAPLDEAENGFAAGTVPGENAVDTKARPGLSRWTPVEYGRFQFERKRRSDARRRDGIRLGNRVPPARADAEYSGRRARHDHERARL